MDKDTKGHIAQIAHLMVELQLPKAAPAGIVVSIFSKDTRSTGPLMTLSPKKQHRANLPFIAKNKIKRPQNSHDNPEKRLSSISDKYNKISKSTTIFLILCSWMILSCIKTTHESLIQDEYTTLPILNISEIKESHFYTIGPIIILLFHFYCMTYYRELSEDIKNLLSNINAPKNIENLFLDRLPSFPPSLKINTDQKGMKTNSRPQILLHWGILVAAPMMALLSAQLSFLAYQSEIITWIQRIVILSDIVLLLYFWPKILQNSKISSETSKNNLFRTAVKLTRYKAITVPSLIVASTSWLWATIPYENLEDWIGVQSEHKLLRDAVFRRSLDLSGMTIAKNKLSPQQIISINSDDPAVLWKSIENVDGIILRNRNFREAKFISANLPNASFLTADLRGANLLDANLSGAKLQYVTAHTAFLKYTKLRGAHIRYSDFSHSTLTGIDLEASIIHSTKFNEDDIDGANLRGAEITSSNFDKSSLQSADFMAADIRQVTFAGTNLAFAKFYLSTIFEVWINGTETSFIQFYLNKADGKIYKSSQENSDRPITSDIIRHYNCFGASESCNLPNNEKEKNSITYIREAADHICSGRLPVKTNTLLLDSIIETLLHRRIDSEDNRKSTDHISQVCPESVSRSALNRLRDYIRYSRP